MKATIDVDGSAKVSEDLPDNPDGSQAARAWNVRADQVAAHAASWPALSAGDKAALADVANETAKRKARGE